MLRPLVHILGVLLFVAHAGYALSSEDAKQALEKALQGCKNKQLCCTICTTTDPCTEVCAGDASAPKEHKGECKDSYSIIGSALRFRHSARDYAPPQPPTASCSPCGQAGGGPGNAIAGVSLTRVHFQDTDIRTSLGTKTGFTWDIWLHCFPPGTIAGGHPTGIPGWQILVSQPQPQPLDFLVLTDPNRTGRFAPEQGHSNRGLVFRKAPTVPGEPGAVTSSPLEAASAVLDLWDGSRMEFEVYIETDANQPRGRLTRYVDRNGNALESVWKYRVDDPAMAGSLRTKLAIRDRLTDAHGRTIRFTYDEARQYSGFWVCTRADLPDGNHIAYRYGVQANVWLGTEERLVGVDHPDGSVTSFAAVSDPTVPGMRWTVDDPAADSAHSRRKTVWFSQGTWINPAKPSEKRGQIFGRVVRIADGAGDIAFLGWFGDFARAGGGSESRSYTWTRGVLSAFVHEDGYKPGASYVWEGPAGADIFAPGWAGWRKQLDRTYSTTTLPGTLTTPEGFSAVYERDSISQRQIRAAYHDGTVERWVRNALGDVVLHRDRLGRLTETAYDAVGNRIAVTRGWIAADPDDLDARTAPHGLSRERWVYWTAADRTAGIPGAGLPGQLRFHYDPNSFSDALASVPDADPAFHRTDYLYTAEGDLAAVVQSADERFGVRAADRREYDAAGRLVRRWDERGILTRYVWDARGRLVQTIYADGSSESITYAIAGPAAGLETARLDRNGNSEETAWDAAGRRVSRLRREPTTVTGQPGRLVGQSAWTYVPGTLLMASETIDGERTIYGYDGEMRLLSTTRAVSGSLQLTEGRIYAGDREVGRVDPYGRRTFVVRDAEERQVRVVRERLPGAVPAGADLAALPRVGGADPAYVIEDTAYDAAGQIVTRRDGNGNQTDLGYDALARVSEIREAVGTGHLAVTAYAYDAAGNRIRVSGPRSWTTVGGVTAPIQTAMAYTGRNLLARVTEAAGSPEETIVRAVEYTATGKIAAEWDAN